MGSLLIEGEFNALDDFRRRNAMVGVAILVLVVMLVFIISFLIAILRMSDSYRPAPSSEPTILRDFRVLYTLDEYHEDFGDVLWWRLPIGEPPYVGRPYDQDFPDDYYTHWSKLVIPDQSPYEK